MRCSLGTYRIPGFFQTWIWVWLLMSTPHVLYAEIPKITNHSKQEYQAQKQNWQVDQTEEGLMAFANTGGLLLYEGQNWHLYQIPTQQIIRTICVDGDRIYCGAYGEFGYWSPSTENGQWSYHSLSSRLEDKAHQNEEIWNIIKQEDDILFQSFGVIYRYRDDRLYQVTPPHSIRFIYGVHDRFYLQVVGHGLMELTREDAFLPVLSNEQIGDVKIVGIQSGGPNTLLMATERHGLFLFDEEAGLRPWQHEANASFQAHQINNILDIDRDLLVVGTISDGLYVLDQDGDLVYHINKQSGLLNNTVLSLFQDRERHLWVGTDDGISHINIHDPIVFHRDFTGQMGTPYAAMLAQDQLYVGTNQGLFCKHWKASFSDESPFELIPGTQGQVWFLQLINDQLICGHNSGTYIIEDRDARKISSISGGWDLCHVPNHPNKIIQGTYNGLVLYKQDERGRWQFDRQIDGFREVVSQVAFDQHSWLWAVNPYRGLHRIRFEGDAFEIKDLQSFSIDQGLPTDYKIQLHEINDSLFFFAKGRYYQYGEKTQEFTLYPGYHHLSLGTKILNGLDHEQFHINHQNVDYWNGDHLASSFSLEVVPGFERIFAIDTQYYLICLEEGYALLDRKAPIKSSSPLQPMITRLSAHFSSGDKIERWNLHRNKWSQMKLPNNLTRIQLEFASLSFGKKNLFSYRLEGFDAAWSSWSSATSAEYTNLGGGTYTFHLSADRSNQNASVTFEILPAWHETWIAAIALTILLILATLAIIRFFNRRLSLHKRRLEIAKQRELHRQKLNMENQMLENQVRSKSLQLADSTMNVIQKNKVIMELRDDLKVLKKSMGASLSDPEYNRLMIRLQRNITDQNDWKVFETNFNEVHSGFFKSLKSDYPELTASDLRLAAYLKMNLTSKEIVPLLNISLRGVENKRYRLRKKMHLDKDDSLVDLLISY